MKYNWFYICLAAVLTGIVIMLWDTRPEDLLKLDRYMVRESPNYDFPYAVLQNATSSQFDENGDLSYSFDAAQLEHYRANFHQAGSEDYMLMRRPFFTLFSEKTPWFISASEGKLSDDGETLLLWNQVRIWQSSSSDNQLVTSELIVKPNERHISTDMTVEIIGPRGKIEAVGMVVDLNEQKIRLLSNVKGFHEPI